MPLLKFMSSRNNLPHARLLLDDVNVSVRLFNLRHTVIERHEVVCVAVAQLFMSVEFVRYGDAIDDVTACIEITHANENPLV
jgi:hypothetical protein